MFARFAASLVLILLAFSALLPSREASLRGMSLSDDARIAEGSTLASGAPIALGDRVIRVDGVEVHRASDVDGALRRAGRTAELRVLSMKDEVTQRVQVSDLQGEAPPTVLTPAYYITSVDGVERFGALVSDVARALAQHGVSDVEVRAVPIGSVFDGSVDVQRGMPPTNVMAGALVTLLALVVVWMLSSSLGLVLGLGASAFSFWHVEAFGWAKVLSLGLVAVAVILLAWLSVEPLSRAFERRGRARSREGKDSLPDLLDALTVAEQEFGFPLHVLVGSAQLAIDVSRDYERLVVADADSITTASLQMLLTEGGVFPRADVGDGVAEVWDDPLHDLDQSAGISCAVPIPRYGSASDQWAFIVTKVRDTPRSMALLEPLLELAELWASNGVREAIAVHASHSLFRALREARNASSVIPHSPARNSSSASGTAAPERTSGVVEAPVTQAVERSPAPLDLVAEGIGVPRTVSRRELARLQDQRGKAPGESSPLSAVTPPRMRRVASEELADARAELREAHDELARYRAWTGHLERHIHDEYPVDVPELLGEAQWLEMQHLRRDERPSLLIGEPGVGKEFMARALHWHGQRGHRRIGVVDCARLPVSVVELELFGDAGEGALVDLLEGGSLVLKSPSALGRGALEPMLDRLLARDIRLYLVERYTGHERGIPRAMSATIRALVGERFVHLRPLRERPEDIIRHARRFLHEEAMIHGEAVRDIDPAAERLLETMDLPSNFVELRVLVRSGLLRAEDETLDVRALLGGSVGDVPRELARIESDDERQKLVAVLQETDGNKSEAARTLGLSRGALLRKLKRHGLM